MGWSLRRASVGIGLALLAGVCGLCACSSDSAEPSDAAVGADSGTSDARVNNGPKPDSGGEDDRGTTADAGSGDDSGVAVDSGGPDDVGPAVDSGYVDDVGPAPDSGGADDTGPSPDTGGGGDAQVAADSGSVDGGIADTGTADTGAADSGAADSGAADAGVADSGTADGGQATGPVIESVTLEGGPIEPFQTNGDLWFTTWADDDALYSSWGDGLGVNMSSGPSDCGIARFDGTVPNITAVERIHLAPTAVPDVNDKPSSLLYANGRLYGHFHSPLGDPWIGYLAYSDDHGAIWTRVGFYGEGKPPPAGASPWTRDRNSMFRCLFFVNMGKAYALASDGYVYGLGIGIEWGWTGGVYLARVPVTEILDYAAYEYFSGLNGTEPVWSPNQTSAAPLAGLSTPAQGSAMYHPGIGRYLFLTDTKLFEAPNPWGPWTLAAQWATKTMPIEWQGGYQPGIITKDAGPDYFWFTISGQNQPPKITYRLHLGKMVMQLRQ